EAAGVPSSQIGEGSSGTPVASRLAAFRDALADDFNTPKALAEVFELVGEANRGEVSKGLAAEEVAEMLELVGLGSLADQNVVNLQLSPITGKSSVSLEMTTPQALLAKREEARAAKEYDRADDIRDQLLELGWEVRDSDSGPRLIRKT
ncbi:MAG TPA: DALR domain-containing protein, partial [Solirubrobacterales bacterium]|nr:DALR domain-containing protein [Solirubrobacterales bacterium]